MQEVEIILCKKNRRLKLYFAKNMGIRNMGIKSIDYSCIRGVSSGVCSWRPVHFCCSTWTFLV